MQSDVKSVNLTVTGTALTARARVVGLFVHSSGGGAATIVLRDGGATGNEELSLVFDATVGTFDVTIPQNGILFTTDVHATLANVDSMTLFYTG